MTVRVPLDRARAVAIALVDALRPGCDRIEIAGSIRRESARVGDIEIVAVPKLAHDLFGTPLLEDDGPLDTILRDLERDGRLSRRAPPRWGRRFKAALATKSGIPVDIFLALPPAQWGAIFAIRTGPADYSARLVTMCQDRGLRCVDGRLVDSRGVDVATPEERDFVTACGAQYEPPSRRR